MVCFPNVAAVALLGFYKHGLHLLGSTNFNAQRMRIRLESSHSIVESGKSQRSASAGGVKTGLIRSVEPGLSSVNIYIQLQIKGSLLVIFRFFFCLFVFIVDSLHCLSPPKKIA